MTNDKAPAGQGEGKNQNPTNQEENQNMSILTDTRSVRQPVLLLKDDLSRRVQYLENVTQSSLLRVHYRLARVTARPGEYTLRHRADATPVDRARAVTAAQNTDLDRFFAILRDSGDLHRRRWSEDRRSWVEYIHMGTTVDDPMVQLELEMMIDQHTGVTR
jgi:hypothetical protein